MAMLGITICSPGRLQGDRGVRNHLLHPEQQAVVIRRDLPERLLPPHRAHRDSQQPIPMLRTVRCDWAAPPGPNGDEDAEDQQQPQYRAAGQIGLVSNVIRSVTAFGSALWPALQPARSPRSRPRRRCAPLASPFSKSPSMRAIWLVTWAKQITGLDRAARKRKGRRPPSPRPARLERGLPRWRFGFTEGRVGGPGCAAADRRVVGGQAAAILATRAGSAAAKSDAGR